MKVNFNKGAYHVTVFKNSAFLFLSQIAGYGIPLIILPYFTRVLGVQSFGRLMILFSLCSLCMLITDFGFNLSGTYYISTENDKNRINEFVGSVFLIKLVLYSITMLILIPVMIAVFKYREPFLLVSVLSICFVQLFQPIWLFQGIQKMQIVATSSIASKLIYAFLIFFIICPDNINGVLVCYLIGQTAASFFCLYMIYHEGFCFKLSSPNKICSVFKRGFSFFISRAAVTVYTSANTLVVGAINGSVEAGYYSSCEKLYMAGMGVLSPISQSFYPYTAKTKNYNFFIKFIMLTAFLLVFFCGFVSFFTEDILLLFYGEEFAIVSDVLKVFLVTIVVNYICVNFGYPAFAAIDKVEFANLTVLIGSVTHILLISVLFFCHKIDALNMALAVLTTEFCVMLFRFVLFCKLKKNKENEK